MLSRFHMVPERNRQTDGQTDLLYQYRDKNHQNAPKVTIWRSKVKKCSAEGALPPAQTHLQVGCPLHTPSAPTPPRL